MLFTLFAYTVLAALAVWAVLTVLAPIGLLAWIGSCQGKADQQANAALLGECEALQAEAQALQTRRTSRLRGI